jgi:hypothetical protein
MGVDLNDLLLFAMFGSFQIARSQAELCKKSRVSYKTQKAGWLRILVS